MSKQLTTILIMLTLVFTSCVSKKDYVALEEQYNATTVERDQLKSERDELQAEKDVVQARIDRYNSKIAMLQSENNENLKPYGNVVLSENDKKRMKEMLANVDPAELANAENANDSINVILSHNLHKKAEAMNADSDGFNINIDGTVVMITIADNLLYKFGSYRLDPKANEFLGNLAELINSEPAIEVVVEGHTDNKKVKAGSALKDNLHLSVERSMSVINNLVNKHDVDPSQLIAAGRGDSRPLYQNDTEEGRAKNRRTRIVILPDLDKFYALLFAENN
ncbi:MAG: hypothetical protein BM564_13265 [Bacteroidetes bacterium MedPE-SWsnd-G2]|nr:MAG: hypothetical protein BM564_13265 [Bacteroidetes bacterium MedPE-SWsnd-G2]